MIITCCYISLLFPELVLARAINVLWIAQMTEVSLREKCPYSEFFWFVFSRECGKIRTRETPNTDTFRAICI